MIDRELVVACYKVFFGREPENQVVVDDKLSSPGYDALFREFVHSAEFTRRLPPAFGDLYKLEGKPIDVDVDAATLSAMFDRIRIEWTRLGETDPYWSVMTHDNFRLANMGPEAEASFFRSGADAAALIDLIARRSNTAPPRGTCLELGCGVGRVTTHLARRFDKVIGIDVAPGNLALCERHLRAEGLINVELQLWRGPDDVAAIPDVDFLFSTIVFQHNPPPVQRFLLDGLASKIRPGGGLLVQIPTHTPGYAFDVKAYLASEPGGMEMHCLPMPTIFDVLHRRGLRLREVLMDDWTGLYGSHTFFAVKPDAALSFQGSGVEARS